MVEKMEATRRARAWILVKAKAPEAAARRLYAALGDQGGDKWVVVRADIVDHEYNVMVPVDAQDQAALDEAHQKIRDEIGSTDTLVIPVSRHIPFPPHIAHGFVHPDEAAVRAFEGPKGPEVGRLGNSPGLNGWG